MKKIDLHLHTVPTVSDSDFEFSIEIMEDYVSRARLSAIAITNHNIFDLSQYETIRERLSIPVLPGIEVDLEGCHVLLIVDEQNAGRMYDCSVLLAEHIKSKTDYITFQQLVDIFGNLRDYIIIPHYDKKPSIQPETLAKLDGYITAGEVDSAKKFIRCAKDSSRLTPVLFSDARMKSDLKHLPTRATYVDCGEITLASLRHCLQDRRKVALSEEDGNATIQVLDDGLKISTGLNVLLGDRSSGKTFTLDRIFEQNINVKYIRQFSLVQMDEEKCKQLFASDIERRKSLFSDDYLANFKPVVEEIAKIDLNQDDRLVENYLETLLELARNADRQDAFSKCSLFNETTIKTGEDPSLKSLIKATVHLIENVEYRDVVIKHIDISDLKSLARELIETLWTKERRRQKINHVNQIITDVKRGLAIRSSSRQLEDVDLYEVTLNKRKVSRFEALVNKLKDPMVLKEESMQGFRVVARRTPYTGAGELKSASGKRVAFRDAWAVYPKPYAFLRELAQIDSIPDSDWHKYFVRIEYEVINKDGAPVSGGERSEFRLLREISDSQKYDMLLIDEPESSFDNTFLSSGVNALIRDISRAMPVIVVTHNSTVGASIGADFFMYAKKDRLEKTIEYRLYCGYPADKSLRSICGREISNYQAQMTSLEAGVDAYQSRKENYENLKD